MRRAVAGFLTGLAVALGIAPGAGAETIPQRPTQITFNARVAPGSVLVVADAPTGAATSSSLCTTVTGLKAVWAQKMSGQEVGANPACPALPSGSRVRVTRKTRAYAVDDPTQPAVPYGNDAHLILEVLVVSVPAAAGRASKTLVGRTGYMIVDDLAWPGAK